MKIVRNYLLIVSSIFSLATFAGESVSEKNIFETLVSEGVFVQARYTNPSELPGTGEFKLNSLQCLRDLSSQSVEFVCNYIDERRPFEGVSFTSKSAEDIFQSLLAEGVPSAIVPFSRGKITLINVTNLRCSKSGFVEDKIKYACYLLKRLIEPVKS